MIISEFKLRFSVIADNIENTNYGSIIAEFKLVILIQESIIGNGITKNQIIEIFEEELNKDIDIEARTQALGEVFINLKDSHKSKSIFDDLGESYISDLFQSLKSMKEKGMLFRECNN